MASPTDSVGAEDYVQSVDPIQIRHTWCDGGSI